MKKLVVIVLSALPLLGFSQEAADSLKKKKLEIGITFSPDMAYRTLRPDAASKDIADTAIRWRRLNSAIRPV